MKQLKVPPKETVAGIRFRAEKRLFDELRAQPHVGRLIDEMYKEEEADANRRRLLASALRITERLAPSITQLLCAAQRITHLSEFGLQNLEIYVHNDPYQNAACMHFPGRGLFLLVSSALIEKLNSHEMLFVVGHELGHALYEHHRIPVHAILDKQRACSAEQALKLMSWSRRAEISADRVGLLCAQDIAPAANSLIKLSCGLNERFIKFDIAAYTSQMEDIQALSAEVPDVRDLFSSHPFNPIRVLALKSFWESEAMVRLLHHSATPLAESEMDRRIEEMLGSMELPSAGRAGVEECLVWGSLWVAASDCVIQGNELETIRGLAQSHLLDQAMERVMVELNNSHDPLELIKNEFYKHAQKCGQMPPMERHGLVEKLVVVAKADGRVEEKELQVLREVCQILGVNPVFVDQVFFMYE